MDETRTRIPIKVKILLSLVLITFVSIGLNLYFTIDIFTQDKKSYIFETALQESNKITDTVIFPIQQITDNLAYISTLRSQKQISNYFQGQHEITFVQHVRNKTVLGSINTTDLTLKELVKISKYPNSSQQPIFLGKQFFYLIKSEQAGSQITILLNLESISKQLQRSKVFKSYLLSKTGVPYTKTISKETQTSIHSLLKSKFNQGTREIQIQETDYLSSFIKNKKYNFSVITLIKKENAFEVISILTKKTIFFGLILLGIAMAVGTIFSTSLTRPINILYDFTKKIREGNYSEKVTVNTNDELRVLANSFNAMTSEISNLLANKELMIKELTIAKAQLEDYSKNLEVLVEQRTAELREAHNFMAAMINSLDQGLLVFNKNCIVSPTYTKVCEELFTLPPEGEHFAKLIGNSKPKEIEALDKWSEIVFSNKLPFESAIGLAPQVIKRGSSIEDSEFQVIDLSYYPMRNEDEEIINIVAVATDKTEEARSKEQFLNKEQYVEMVMKMIQNKKQFLSFIQEVDNIISNIERNYDQVSKKQIPFSCETFLIDFHTLNGGFGMYSALALQRFARKIEGELVALREQPDEQAMKIMPALGNNITELKKQYTNFLTECATIFGKSLDDERSTVVIKKTYIEELQYKLSANEQDSINYLEEFFIKIPILEHFTPYIDLVSDLQTRLDKKINPLTFIGSDLRVLPGQYIDFYQTLVHLFRNCCDHGIEQPDVREKRGKELAGTIEVNTFKTSTHLVIQVSDDGNGIDPAKIREKLLEMNPDKSYDHISDKEIIYQVFEPHFSTATNLTSVSGRGVGMSAIKEVVQAHNGSIKIQSKLEAGTIFKFLLPS